MVSLDAQSLKSSENSDTADSKQSSGTGGPSKFLSFKQKGIWTVMTEEEHHSRQSWNMEAVYRNYVAHTRRRLGVFPYVYRFLSECFNASPPMAIAYLLLTFWGSIQAAMDMYVSHRLLQTIQDGVVKQHMNGHALLEAALLRLSFAFAEYMISMFLQRIPFALQNKIHILFQERMLRANLRLDMPTFEGPLTAKINQNMDSNTMSSVSWRALGVLLHKLQSLMDVVSQLGVLHLTLKAHPGGYWFLIVCLMGPMYNSISSNRNWDTIMFAWDSNPHFRRLSSFRATVLDGVNRLGIISEGCASYILKESAKAQHRVGDAREDEVYTFDGEFSLGSIIRLLLGELPLLFYGYQVYLSPKHFSLSSIVLVQQASHTLPHFIYRTFTFDRTLEGHLKTIQELYELPVIPNKIKEGSMKYPSEKITSSGMEISLKNVTFCYPNSDPAIKDVSFTIKKGETVVIVGVNGSGKSTLLKLINRIYDVTSGTILVDGLPLTSYVSADVRRSMAIMFQSFSHYPLSIRENISMGLVDTPDDESDDSEDGRVSVETAAKLGGSIDIVNKQRAGLDTVLQPIVTATSRNTGQAGEPFLEKMEEIQRQEELSLGQWQRLALSRLFYRSAAKHIRLVAADEPSASLDPQMEYELFRRLRALSSEQGKTLVYVTHRFGYLTKTADLILVMQEGRLVEQGTHKQLVAMGGEYTKLYNLQAEAFLPDAGE